MKYSFLKYFLALPIWLALGWGCTVSEKHEPVTPGIPGTDETQVTILVDVPGMETPSTRSIAGADGEAEVKTVDILVFDNTSPAKLTEHAKAVNITNNVDTGIGEGTTGRYTVQFQAKLTANTNAASVMIVANASDEVDAAVLAAGSNAEKQNLLAELTFASSNPGGTVAGWKWNATSSTNYTPIPMYGEKAISGMTQGMRIDGIELVRMLARVDVVNNATSNFTLSEIYLVNYNTAGYIAPAWNTSNGVMLSSLPSTPMLPTSPGTKNGEVWAIPYTYAHNGGTGYLGEIYTYEAPATTGVDGSAAHTNAACLIVKGKLTGDTNDYYYRIDFTEGVDGAGKVPGATGFDPSTVSYMSIYRNHKYIVSIAAAEGVGHLQFFDALYSLGVMTNLKTSLHVVDESTITNMAFDGQYYVGLGDDVSFGPSAATDEVLAVTNYSTGWGFDTDNYPTTNGVEYLSGGTGWLTLTKESSGDVKKANIEIAIASNTSGVDREAYIHIRAGRLTNKLKVSQEKGFIRIVSTDPVPVPVTSLEFRSRRTLIGTAPVAQEFVVEWEPADQPLSLAKTTASGDNVFSWQNTTTNGMTTVPAGGSYTFQIDPVGITQVQVDSDPFFEKNSKLTFTMGGGTAKTVDLKHVHYNILTQNFGNVYNPGNTFNATIVTNDPGTWTGSCTADPGSVISSYSPASGTGSLSGSTFTYNLLGGITYQEATFTFGSTLADNVTVTVSSGAIAPLFARSNIVLYVDASGNQMATFAETSAANSGQTAITTKAGQTVTRPAMPANVQGLHFRWGSLMGITSDGIAASRSAYWNGNSTSGHVVFIPKEYPSGSIPATWIYFGGSTATSVESNGVPWAANDNFPYSASAGTNSDAFLAKYPKGSSPSGYTGYNPATGQGDICRYISDKGWVEGKWRMPTAYEYQVLVGETTVANGVRINASNGAVFGTYYAVTGTPANPRSGGTGKYGFTQFGARMFGVGAKSADASTTAHCENPGPLRVVFPGSGALNYSSGEFQSPGHSVQYYSATSASTANSYALYLTASGGFLSNALVRSYGLPVRCIIDYD